MRTLKDTQFSILELVPVRDDKSVEFALKHALELAAVAAFDSRLMSIRSGALVCMR